MRSGKHYSVNVPLKDGMTDEQFLSVFTRFVLIFFHYFYNVSMNNLFTCGILCEIKKISRNIGTHTVQENRYAPCECLRLPHLGRVLQAC